MFYMPGGVVVCRPFYAKLAEIKSSGFRKNLCEWKYSNKILVIAIYIEKRKREQKISAALAKTEYRVQIQLRPKVQKN